MIIFSIFAGLIVLFGFVVFRGAPYVPSHSIEVKRAFDELYPLNKKSVLVDVGSGDGVILRLAAERGATAIGIELNPLLVLFSRLRSIGNDKISVRFGDFWLHALPDTTTVVYAFSVSRDQKKLARKLQREADRLQRPIDLLTYGAGLNDKKPVKVHRGHKLYHFSPLQTGAA